MSRVIRNMGVPGVMLLLMAGGLSAQQKELLSYVDPFIGTAKSDVYTRWGNEGGTYPGAVAPWGYMQLSPETRQGKGYDYSDSSICYFSCAHHLSGYPNGSAGSVRVMPVRGDRVPETGPGDAVHGKSTGDAGAGDAVHGDVNYARRFVHGDEYANPGYYRVRFADDGTMVEATASVRVGVFRFSFPAGVSPLIYVGGIGGLRAGSDRELMGKGLPAAMVFSEPFTLRGDLLHFNMAATGPTAIVMIVSVSPMGSMDAALRAGALVEGMGRPWPEVFDVIRKETEETWRRNLGVVTIDDDRETPKRIFYTALYHSMLLPWIVSNADGYYQGMDGKVHQTSGKNSYGSFSPWDTFRSLHPLMSLLFPDRQRDMVSSLLDMYKESGQIPTGPMTGDHGITVIVDSWLKGIRTGDSSWVYRALRKSIADTPYSHEDRAVYLQKGYIPLSYPESVTRTLEYAYDDWSLSEFAAKVMHRDGDSAVLGGRGTQYMHLFDPSAMLMLPRAATGVFRQRPGTSGYKEGDPWVYSYFVPQHPESLVDLMGGEASFAGRLDTALEKGDIVFDNETVFHIPYLFNYAGQPGKTEKWVRAIRDGRYSAGPGGLPGNDDMGSMSSWFVFSAMGFYPVCPGRPLYDLGTPLFRSMRLRLAGGKEFVIRAPALDETRTYVRSITVNGERYHRLFLPHGLIVEGGTIEFGMGSSSLHGRAIAVKKRMRPAFSVAGVQVGRRKVRPNEMVWIKFRLHNAGVVGTKIVALRGNGLAIASRNCLVEAGATIVDSVAGRFYAYGKIQLKVDGLDAGVVEVVREGQRQGMAAAEVSGLSVRPLLKKNEEQVLTYTVQNIGGAPSRVVVPVRINEQVVLTDSLWLEPGEKRDIMHRLGAPGQGLGTVKIMGARAIFKRYEDPKGSLLLDLVAGPATLGGGDSLLRDRSGFGNDGKVIGDNGATGRGSDKGKDFYVEVENAASLDRMGETLTMMARVFPMARGEMLVDIFTKGDNHVLQVAGNNQLTFFAGGWGRGDCTVALPADWFGHWHHIAGVCTGPELFVYIDGVLKGSAKVDGRVNLSVENKWVLGRNEEFPGQRIFHGIIEGAKVFSEALSAEDILYFSKEGGSSHSSLP